MKMTKAFTSLLPAPICRRYFRQLQPHVRRPTVLTPEVVLTDSCEYVFELIAEIAYDAPRQDWIVANRICTPNASPEYPGE